MRDLVVCLRSLLLAMASPLPCAQALSHREAMHATPAARHWIVLVLACELVIPHPGSFAAQLAVLAGGLMLLCVALAACETVQAKMRILRVPSLLASGAAVCLLGLASWFAGGGG